ncbi:MAG: S-layer homology domain-containing protein, partial [Oscillospiraceae bacterium]
ALATILTNLLGLTAKAENTYSDLRPEAWYADAVLKCTAAGIMKGDGTSARPEANISRQESMVMLARALGIQPAKTTDLTAFTDADTVATWAAPYVTAMTEAQIVGGVAEGVLAPAGNMNRASVVTILDKAVSDYIATAGIYDKLVGTGIVIVAVPEVVLKGNTITGSLLVTEGVGSGSVTLNHAKIPGHTTLRGDETFAVIEGGSVLGEVTVAGKNAAVMVDGISHVETLSVMQTSATITVEGAVTALNASKEAAGMRLNVSEHGTVSSMVTHAPRTVIANDGKMGTLTLGQDAVQAKYVAGAQSTMPKVTSESTNGLTTITKEEDAAGDQGGGIPNSPELKGLLTFVGYLVADSYTPGSWAAVTRAKARSSATQEQQKSKLIALYSAVNNLSVTGTAKTKGDALTAKMKRYFEGQNDSAIHAVTLHIDTQKNLIKVCVFQPEILLGLAMQGSGIKSAFTEAPVVNITMMSGEHTSLIDAQGHRDLDSAAILIANAIGAKYGMDPYLGTLSEMLALPTAPDKLQVMLGCGSDVTHGAPTEYNVHYTLEFYQSPVLLQECDLTLAPHATGQLTPLTQLSGEKTWTSSNASIASVDANGTVTAHRAGTATISFNVAGNAGFPAQALITVKP